MIIHFKTYQLRNEKITDYKELTARAADYLKTKLGYRPSTIKKHCDRWGTIKKFMDSRSIKTYGQTVEKQLIYHRFRNRNYRQLTAHEKDLHNSIRTLTQFALTGQITALPGIDRRKFVFNGPIGMQGLLPSILFTNTCKVKHLIIYMSVKKSFPSSSKSPLIRASII